MSEKVYLVIHEDRHTDLDIEVWRDKDLAIASAKNTALQMVAMSLQPDLILENFEGTLYYAQYSYEGDCVWVTEKTPLDTEDKNQ